VFDLAFDGVIKVAVVAHPSLLEKPADLEVIQLRSITFEFPDDLIINTEIC
jgi:hypothetical protein